MEIVDVSCAVIRDGERIFATQRSMSMPHPLKWEFPGGKLRSGESALESIVREIKEEMGVLVRPLKELSPVTHHYSQHSIRLIPVLCEFLDPPSAILLSEHADWRWIDRAELHSLDWLEADLGVIAQLH